MEKEVVKVTPQGEKTIPPGKLPHPGGKTAPGGTERRWCERRWCQCFTMITDDS